MTIVCIGRDSECREIALSIAWYSLPSPVITAQHLRLGMVSKQRSYSVTYLFAQMLLYQEVSSHDLMHFGIQVYSTSSKNLKTNLKLPQNKTLIYQISNTSCNSEIIIVIITRWFICDIHQEQAFIAQMDTRSVLWTYGIFIAMN